MRKAHERGQKKKALHERAKKGPIVTLRLTMVSWQVDIACAWVLMTFVWQQIFRLTGQFWQH